MKTDSLTTNEKVVLAQQLWDSVAANEDSLQVSASHKAELDRRVSGFASDGNTWDTVKSRSLNK
jgi:putative addiction module component (TIGR02574 family)